MGSIDQIGVEGRVLRTQDGKNSFDSKEQRKVALVVKSQGSQEQSPHSSEIAMKNP